MPVVKTNKENAMELAAHGTYSLKKTKNILYVDAHGPFNEVTTQQYAKEIDG